MSKWELQALLPKKKPFSRYFSQGTSKRLNSLPSIAPKPSINIKHIRQNPELYCKACIERNYEAYSDNPSEIVALFEEWRDSQESARTFREINNDIRTRLSRAFSGVKEDGVKEDGVKEEGDKEEGVKIEGVKIEDVKEEGVKEEGVKEEGGQDEESKLRDALLEAAQQLKKTITVIETREDELNTKIEDLALELPNLISDETPRGHEPKVLRYINEPPNPPSTLDDQTPIDHVYIGQELDLIDFAGAGTTSGWGWYYLKNEAALLEQALIQYALQVATSHGFKPTTPPSIVYTHIATACGFRPRDQNDEQQIYTLQQSPKDLAKGKPTHSLAGTAEIPLAGLKANTVINPTDLPIKLVGPSRCFRAEAGARGVETRGLYRVHEFTKVEMFAWTLPDSSAENDAFTSMLAVQSEILHNLGLHCRVLEMPSHDLGASAVRKNDIEAFFPGRRQRGRQMGGNKNNNNNNNNDGWGEVTSLSICTDYQSRRLNTRVRGPEGKMMGFPSTVNGTALAVPRVLAAVLENGWIGEGEEGGVRVPEVLWPFMQGVRFITRKKS